MLGRMFATSVFGAALGSVAGGYSTGGSAQGILAGAAIGAVGGGALGALSRTPRVLAGIKGTKPKQIGPFAAVGGAFGDWLAGRGGVGLNRLTSFAKQGPSEERIAHFTAMYKRMKRGPFLEKFGIASKEVTGVGMKRLATGVAARGQMARNIAGMAGVGIGGLVLTNFATGGLGATFGTGVGAIGGFYGGAAGGRGRGMGILGAVIGAGLGNYMTGGRLDTDVVNRRRGRGMSYGY